MAFSASFNIATSEDCQSYSVHRTKYGIYVRSEIPVGDLVALIDAWKKLGYDIIDSGLSESLGASLVITNKKKAAQWRKELAIGPDNPDWLKSGDTGSSSKTIYSVMTGIHGFRGTDGPRAPSDPDDFGRCYRLVKRFPQFKPRLSEVSAKYPEWETIVREWDALSALYEEEFPSGEAPKLYALMQKLQEEYWASKAAFK